METASAVEEATAGASGRQAGRQMSAHSEQAVQQQQGGQKRTEAANRPCRAIGRLGLRTVPT